MPAPDAWSRDAGPHRAARPRPGRAVGRASRSRWTLDGGEEASVDGDERTVEIAADGRHTVGYRAIDGAGNASDAPHRRRRVDRTPPETVAFEAPDPADPRCVRVVVADATSGVASGRIELRRAGGEWQRRARRRSNGGRLVARLDDATLRAGAYELRAVVADVAGNEAIGTRRADGAPAAVTLPLRRATALACAARAARCARG